MSENNQTPEKKSISPDWLVRGVLAKIGETFDRLTGRNWKPSSSLATSELIDRLKKLLDAEAKDLNGRGKFVPHNIKLKMQWDKFSTDADVSLKKLENELLIAAVDHINDNRYHTYAPMSLEIKPDYFTEGVKLMASFDSFADDEREAQVNVSVPDLKNVVIAAHEEVRAEQQQTIFNVEFTAQNKTRQTKLVFGEKKRLSVGRTKENDLQIDDPSISKIHAALVLNSEKHLMVADTGSTNGTFINRQRIAYGKAIGVSDADKLKFGNVEVLIERAASETEIEETPVEETVSFETQPPNNAAPKKENVVVIQPIAAAPQTNRTNGEENAETDAMSEPRIKLDFGDGK